ncbi:MAG: hypothetical protein IKW21_04005 [Lachnospiraceae bacterium]|nr:hypothetical protein [Lachnospiraceae bacterium]
MKLFELFGTIAVNNSEANEAIDETVGKAEKSGGKLSKTMGTLGKGVLVAGKLAGAAVGAVGGAMILVTEKTREYRTEMGKLDTAFESAGHTSKAAKETYSELNSILGDSGQAVEAANHLAKLTKNEKELQTWTKICTGVYATFGASLPIEGLTEAANETAKTGALTGSLADALNWAGVSEDKFQESLDACNTEQERQALITETLNGLYSETAEKYRETNKDVIEAQKAQDRLNDSMAKVGAAIEPIMSTVKLAIADMAEAAIPIVEYLIETFGNVVDKGMEIYDSVSEYFPAIQETVMNVFGSIGTFWDETLQPCLAAIGEYVMNTLVPIIMETFMEKILPTVKEVFGFITTFWNDNLQPCLAAIGTFLSETLVPAFRFAFEEYIKPTVENIFNAIKNLWENTLKPVLVGITDFLTGVFSGDWEKAWEGIKGIVEGIWNYIVTLFETAKEQVQIVFDYIKEIISAAVEKIAEFLNFEELKQNILKKFEAIKTGIKSKIEWARDKVDAAVRKIKSVLNLETLKNSVLGKFDSLKNGIKDKIEWAKEKVRAAIDAIKGFFNFTFTWPKIPLPHFSVSPQGWKIGDLLKGSIPSLGIEFYAKGAVMKKPTIFDIDANAGKLRVGGEAGPEAVAPISTLQSYVEEAVANQLGKLFSKFDTDEEMVLYAEINNFMDGKKMTSDIVETVIKKISRQQLNKQRAVGFV